MNKKENNTRTETLRVAFPYAKPASAYEPANIHLAPEYIFLENVFSPLVELSAKSGEVQPGVAEHWEWKNNELRLTIRKGLKTIDGIEITAADAEFSLKRLLSIPGNTHGDFKKLICGGVDIKSIKDSCEGIRVEGNELVLKTNSAGKTFLLPMLAAIDFAIIPRSSVDMATLEIRDFRNTTGPYYVYRDSAEGKIELRINPQHYHYAKDIPQIVELVPSDLKNPRASFEDFSEGRVDLLTTIDMARADDVIEFSRSQSESMLHTSQNIRSFVMDFSERGVKEFSSEERFAIGKAVRESFREAFAGKNGYEESSQFFPTFGEGALDKERMKPIELKFSGAGKVPNTHLKVALVRLGDTSKFVSALKKALPSVEVSERAKGIAFTKSENLEELPHFTIRGPDTGFQEDIGLISYTLNAGYFGMKSDERKTWLEKYMVISEKAERLKLLRQVHEAALREPIIVPLLVAPYAALARKPWKIGLSSLYANNQLWLIQHD